MGDAREERSVKIPVIDTRDVMRKKVILMCTYLIVFNSFISMNGVYHTSPKQLRIDFVNNIDRIEI